jgi:hypothetical protein
VNQQPIYELALHLAPASPELRRAEPSVVYFSNLKKTVEFAQAVLVLHGWEARLNYTAVYRGLKLRDRFAKEFSAEGVVFFRLVISRKILNPVLPALEMPDFPKIHRKK